ncbi:BICD family-like cargo adapter 1 isoform X2 [Rhopilema esculentum]|uniref:BICD family-like cargo adapter 1 isoform X2 n=1 Tax=Rhopilema esculentum TaxID=499914 RepID=UPI0031E12DD2
MSFAGGDSSHFNKSRFPVQTLKRRIEGRSMSASYCSEDYLELKMVNEQIRKLRSENKSLGEALEDLATEKLSFMEDAEKSKEKIVVLEQKAKHLEQQIVIAKSELDESKSSNLQLKEQLEDYILQASRMSFTASNSLLNELESSIHEEGDRMFVDSKLDDNDEFTPKFMSSPDRLRNGRVSSLECEREDKESPATDHQYLRNNSSDSSTTECLERQIEELNKKLNESTRSYEQLYKKYTTNVGQLRNAETRIIDMEQQVNYYQRELDMYKKEREIIMNEGSIDTALAISLEDRRKAYKGENEALRQLEQAKSDMVKLNNQLLEAVQQKLELSEQLEMWQVDMAALIEKQLNKTPGKQESKGHRKSRLFTGRWSWSSATKAS